MQINPIQAVVGGYFFVMGLVMVIFYKSARAFHEDLFGNLGRYLPLMPRGRLITVFSIFFGVLSIIGGALVFLLALPID